MFALGVHALVLAAAAAFAAGAVKGAVGFAMPMILVSAFGSFLPAELAVAALILPTFASNLVQALRGGLAAAVQALRRYGRLVAVLVGTILISSQALPVLPQAVLFAALGVPISLYALAELSGRSLRLPDGRGTEVVVGVIGGVFGGLSGVWGPLVVAWLTGARVPKADSMRAQGVIYLAGSVALIAGHLASGVLNRTTLGLSAALVVPALAGMAAGFAVHDRLDPARFRRWTLIVLALAGANLVRRALAG
ncbi:MAG: sulfite exporter TauE/SafE family protein [Rhodobacteraceae bacterium]|nr:sulfite exporter TauE/SafE family protein [Paracoccaceae bacterium]